MAGPGLRVWVTRAEPGASATAQRLRARGHAALIASLLQVRELAPAGEFGGAAALAFTSANAVQAFARLTPARDQEVRAVGEATAEAARQAGFSRVRSAGGDVASLADAFATDPPRGEVLHPCGRETAGDLAGALDQAGIAVRPLVIYETLAVAALPPAAAWALDDGALDAVLLHSPKAARTLAGLLAAHARPKDVRAFGLSRACLSPLEGAGFAALIPAAAPNEAALLARLR